MEPVEEGGQVALVLLGISAGDQDVIEVDEQEVEALAHGVHEPLKGLCCVPESERGPEELIEAEMCDDSRFVDVLLCHRDLMVAAHQIDL